MELQLDMVVKKKKNIIKSDDEIVKELELKKHIVKRGKAQFPDFGESIDRKNLQSKNVELGEEEEFLNEKHPGKEYKVEENEVDTSDTTEFDFDREKEEQDYDAGEPVHNSTEEEIKEIKSRIKYYDEGNVASAGPEENEDEVIPDPLHFKSDTVLQQPETEVVNNLEDYDLNNGYVSKKRRAKAFDATENEILTHQSRTLNRDVLNSRDRLGKNSYDPGDNLKTMNPKKKERGIRGLLRKILGKDAWVKGEKFQKRDEILQKQEDFYDADLFDLDEDREHPMSSHWKDEE